MTDVHTRLHICLRSACIMSRRLSSSASGRRPAAFFDFSPYLSSARLTVTSALIRLRVVPLPTHDVSSVPEQGLKRLLFLMEASAAAAADLSTWPEAESLAKQVRSTTKDTRQVAAADTRGVDTPRAAECRHVSRQCATPFQ
eukprot:TRINITY_DN947_c0_g1_i3.p1 TRINITY_DN947_c0_g1~~TRINITY_DN947_c0_g1_i3.p1  ORF type:complete len:142 (-),score=12.81 TRINITY_DN947_c0_g1_i3:25-450(-)